MPRRTQQQKREDGHWPSFSRFRRGTSPFGRPVYGWEVECECKDFSKRVNGDKYEATSWHNHHLNEDVT